jgi:hypothetical protein
MNRFKDLLKPTPGSDPRDEQRRASKGLADAVAASNLRWWKESRALPDQGTYLLLAVAPYSQYDLALLDLIDERLREFGTATVYVVNLLDYDSIEAIRADFPAVVHVQQTPLAALWIPGHAVRAAAGKAARDLAAELLGLSPDEVARRVLAESPSYLNSLHT